MTKPLDPEIKALRAIERALRNLSIDQRDRILVWAVGSLVEDEKRASERLYPGRKA